jgi:hypothetical protein
MRQQRDYWFVSVYSIASRSRGMPQLNRRQASADYGISQPQF